MHTLQERCEDLATAVAQLAAALEIPQDASEQTDPEFFFDTFAGNCDCKRWGRPAAYQLPSAGDIEYHAYSGTQVARYGRELGAAPELCARVLAAVAQVARLA